VLSIIFYSHISLIHVRTLSDPFPAMSADASARANFAAKCVELIEAYGFDGIDIGKLFCFNANVSASIRLNILQSA
jgi:hypothetical protein